MLLYDPHLIEAYSDYGIMLPISPHRAPRVINFLHQTQVLDARPLAPVFDSPEARRVLGVSKEPCISRDDLERVHQKEFIAVLYQEGSEGTQGLLKALLHTYELL
ncbi:MAG: hypothetical protein LBD74_02460, partial [Spirochaetaceae bacterium]|nr:hypothetical protein [Spirochaetaceae bacterium]